MGWWWGKLQKIPPVAQTITVIQTVEFGLSFACLLSAWFSTDMVLIVPALILGWAFAAVGVFSSPNGTVSAKIAWSLVVALIFAGTGIFLRWHADSVKEPPPNVILPHVATAEEIAAALAATEARRHFADVADAILSAPYSYYIAVPSTGHQGRAIAVLSEAQQRAPLSMFSVCPLGQFRSIEGTCKPSAGSTYFPLVTDTSGFPLRDDAGNLIQSECADGYESTKYGVCMPKGLSINPTTSLLVDCPAGQSKNLIGQCEPS